jgi:hypothetical protein
MFQASSLPSSSASAGAASSHRSGALTTINGPARPAPEGRAGLSSLDLTIRSQHSGRSRGAAFGSTTSSQCPECPSSVRLANAQQERPMNHQPRKENHMNTVQKAILRACWQEEQCDTHAPRPWLRWLLIRVVGMTTIPSRKSEKSQLAKEQWLVPPQRRGTPIRSRDSRGVLEAWTNLRPLRRRGSVRGISVYRSQLLCPFARE